MLSYVLKRIGLALVTCFIIVTMSFLLIKLLPYEKPLGEDEKRYAVYQKEIHLGYIMDSPVELEGYRFVDKLTINGKTEYFYEVPMFDQYFNWLGNIVLHWDWGLSTQILPGNSAMSILARDLPTTIKINIWSVLISVPTGILLGIWAALKKNTGVDHTISTSIMIFSSIPSFVMITVFMLLLCYNTGWLPTQWPATGSPMDQQVKGYILPVLCLSYGSIAGYARAVRAELCEVMSSDYLLLARTKGLTKNQAITRHALRNAMVPIVPSILAEFLSIMGGSMILEQLYGIPGIGSLFVESMNAKDYNVLFVDMAIFTTFGLLAGVLLDISYGFIDPRIRMGAKK